MALRIGPRHSDARNAVSGTLTVRDVGAHADSKSPTKGPVMLPTVEKGDNVAAQIIRKVWSSHFFPPHIGGIKNCWQKCRKDNSMRNSKEVQKDAGEMLFATGFDY